MGDARDSENLFDLSICCVRELAKEGLAVRRNRRGAKRRDILEFVVTNRAHHVHVIVVPGRDVDSVPTRDRITAAARRAETRVFVRWPLRWRMISNLERWQISGVAVNSV